MMDETKGMNINFEFTAPYTPEMNGKIERKFATLYGKARSMLNAAKLPNHLKKGLWAQCAQTASKLENIIVSNEDEKSPAEQFHGANPKWSTSLRTFGEMVILNDDEHRNIRSKLADRGYPAMFVGYPDHHAQGVYEFMKISNHELIASRNITWLNKNYIAYKEIEQNKILNSLH